MFLMIDFCCTTIMAKKNETQIPLKLSTIFTQSTHSTYYRGRGSSNFRHLPFDKNRGRGFTSLRLFVYNYTCIIYLFYGNSINITQLVEVQSVYSEERYIERYTQRGKKEGRSRVIRKEQSLQT